MARRFARSHRGERAIASVPKNHGENITLIGALNTKGIVAAMTIEGASDGEVFETYIDKILCKELSSDNIVIMDNLGSHKNEKIKELINQTGAKLLFLPPYSPDLSPIEECWSKIKEYLRSQAKRTYAALYKAITESFNQVSENDAKGWFRQSSKIAQLIRKSL
jgi:transposase